MTATDWPNILREEAKRFLKEQYAIERPDRTAPMPSREFDGSKGETRRDVAFILYIADAPSAFTVEDMDRVLIEKTGGTARGRAQACLTFAESKPRGRRRYKIDRSDRDGRIRVTENPEWPWRAWYLNHIASGHWPIL